MILTTEQATALAAELARNGQTYTAIGLVAPPAAGNTVDTGAYSRYMHGTAWPETRTPEEIAAFDGQPI